MERIHQSYENVNRKNTKQMNSVIKTHGDNEGCVADETGDKNAPKLPMLRFLKASKHLNSVKLTAKVVAAAPMRQKIKVLLRWKHQSTGKNAVPYADHHCRSSFFSRRWDSHSKECFSVCFPPSSILYIVGEELWQMAIWEMEMSSPGGRDRLRSLTWISLHLHTWQLRKTHGHENVSRYGE